MANGVGETGSPAARPSATILPALVRLAVFFYVGLAAVAVLLNAVRGAPLVPLGLDRPELLPALVLAVALALVAVVFSQVATARFEWGRKLAAFFRRLLGQLGRGEVLLLALSSGIGEELFFRGSVEPALEALLGSEAAALLVTTAFFAALHTAPRSEGLLAWTAFAFVLGLVLGLLFLYSRSVLPPIALHFTVNFLNLWRIGRRTGPPWPGGGGGGGGGATASPEVQARAQPSAGARSA